MLRELGSAFTSGPFWYLARSSIVPLEGTLLVTTVEVPVTNTSCLAAPGFAKETT